MVQLSGCERIEANEKNMSGGSKQQIKVEDLLFYIATFINNDL